GAAGQSGGSACMGKQFEVLKEVIPNTSPTRRQHDRGKWSSYLRQIFAPLKSRRLRFCGTMLIAAVNGADRQETFHGRKDCQFERAGCSERGAAGDAGACRQEERHSQYRVGSATR